MNGLYSIVLPNPLGLRPSECISGLWFGKKG